MSGEPILIVDDNAANALLLSYLLSRKGYLVRTATNGREALAALDEFQPRVIMMDIQLPGMDGLELTRHLKSKPETKDIVIIVLTAYAMKGDETRAREAGCDDYISKPIDTRTLPGIIEAHLHREAPPASSFS
jgi:two-component system, cell cycle response regulator DivK